MTAASITALIVAATGLITAVTALYHALTAKAQARAATNLAARASAGGRPYSPPPPQ